MADMIKILHVEDNSADGDFLLRHLRRAGLVCECRRVETDGEFRRQLDEFRPDLIMSDYSMPHFSGIEALEIARSQSPGTPFIFVSGTIREDTAVEALKAGAADYVLKDNLKRLVPAIERALNDVRLLDVHHQGEQERARLEQMLRDSEAALRRAQSVAGLAHIITGEGGRFISWAQSLPHLMLLPAEQIPADARGWMRLIHPEDRERFRSYAIEAGKQGQRRDLEYRMQRGDGSWMTIRQIIEPMDGEVAQAGALWFNTIQDVSEQKRAEERIQRQNRVYAVLSGINTLIVRVRDRAELFREVCRIAVEDGHFSLAWIGMVDRNRLNLQLMASHDTTAGYVDLLPLGLDQNTPGGLGLAGRAVWERKALIANDVAGGSQLNILKEEALARGFRSMVVLPLIIGEEVIGVLSLYSDVPEFFDSEEMRLLLELAGDVAFALDHLDQADRLEYLAYYDPLTGLANRRLFEERLTQFIAAAARENCKLAVITMDLVRFKTINDTFGRKTGDALLKQLADRAVRYVGNAGLLARLGGDHFLSVITEIDSGDEVGRRIEERIRGILGAPFHIGEADFRLAVKVGAALYPDDGEDAEVLLKNAEVALKRAKAGHEPYLFFDERMTERVAEKLMLENRLREAVEKEEFVLHYQPKVALDSGEIVGAEALIRWNSPDLGLVPPLQFIPMLEETGLILEVGAWALRQAAADFGRLAQQGLRPPRIAVNVSPMQLRRPEFVETVRSVLSQNALSALSAGIDLEITESLLMEDVASSVAKLKAIRELGVSIAIDDFGTGYSSLAYLAKLPVQTLKIDRSFIITMLQEPDTMTLVSTMISLAHSLRLKVVAEGVDAEEQARILRLLRCDEMQGYLFSKPLPIEGLALLLENQQRPA